jgi:PAS domain S-box-containing protein
VTGAPSFEDIFTVMAAASVGDLASRVALPADPQLDDTATKFAIALNILLDDLAFRAAAGDRQLAERERIATRLRMLADAAREFSAATDDLERLLDAVAHRLSDAVGDLAGVRLLSEDGQWLVPAGTVYHRDPALLALAREGDVAEPQRIATGMSGQVASTGQPLIVSASSTAELVANVEPRYRSFLERLGATTALAVPLVCRGRILGVANLVRNSPGKPYDDEDLRFVQGIADHAALAIENARSYAAEREARDVAEKAARALRESEARFARLAESGIIGILVARLDGTVLGVNDMLLDLIGYSREEILSQKVAWRQLTPPEWAEVDARAIEQLKSSGVAGLREKEYIRKDGVRVPILLGSAMLERDSDESITFVLDITERKQAQHKARLAAIVDSSDDAIVGKTLEGVVTSWNHGAQRLFGYSAEEIIGKPIAVLVPPECAGEEPSILATAAQGVVNRFDTVRLRKDGSRVDVSVTISPVRDAAGRVVGVSKVARDITERKRVEEALARAKDKAESANRELEAFSYSVAHDLRTPLRGMNGFAQLLLEGYSDKLDAEGQDWLRRIRVNARKMGELIDGLLSLARVTRSELRPAPVDLSALVGDMAAELRAAEPERAVELRVQPDLHAELDPRLARVVLQNLLANAWKFTSKAEAPRIDVGAIEQDGAPVFFVRDNGAGFDMAFANKLFAPFQRLHGGDEFPGTGIGLATVQRIVNRHGGRVWAEGAVDGGATFYFTVPAPGARAQAMTP